MRFRHTEKNVASAVTDIVATVVVAVVAAVINIRIYNSGEKEQHTEQKK